MHDRKLVLENDHDAVRYLNRIIELELQVARLERNWRTGVPYPCRQNPSKPKYESCCMQPRLKLPSIKMEECATCGARFILDEPVNIQHQRG